MTFENLRTGHWPNIYYNMLRQTICWIGAYLDWLAQWFCTIYKLYFHKTQKSWTIHLQWISWPLLHLTWLARHETWLLPCGTHWGGRWGSSGPNEVFWPCKTLGCKNFFVRMQQRRSKKCVKRRLNLKFYKLFAPPLNNDFSHGAGVQ